MIEHKLPSGATLEIKLLSSERAWNINQRIFKVLETTKVQVEGLTIENLKDKEFITKRVNLSSFKDALCSLMASDVVLAAAKECLVNQCVYNGMKITKIDEAFESREARGDFMPAAAIAIWENVSPFLSGLLSFSLTSDQTTKGQDHR
jgi:hypothetical protein